MEDKTQKGHAREWIAIFLITLLMIVGAYKVNEAVVYINELEQIQAVLLEENEGLRKELEEKSEQLLISNDKLKMIEMRNESIEYMER